MKVIFARSPYTISIDEATQLGTKLELRVWHKGETKPTDPTYLFSLKNPSVTQTENIYNIAPFIKEFIGHVNPDLTNVVAGFEEENAGNWCLIEVKTYYDSIGTGITYTLIDTLDFVGVNGFTTYTGGANQIEDDSLVYLCNDEINRTTNLGQPDFSTEDNIPYFNVICEWEANTGEELKILYKDLALANLTSVVVLTDADPAEIYNFKIPYRWDDVNYALGNNVEVQDTNRVNRYNAFLYTTVEECKYTPVRCDYVNRFGGWETITFFKARTDAYQFESKDFSLLPDNWDYNPLRGEGKSFNHIAKQSVKLNTGWVEENFMVLLFDLMASETILLDNISSKIITKSTPVKTAIKDKMINYEIDFEYNFNLINNTQ